MSCRMRGWREPDQGDGSDVATGAPRIPYLTSEQSACHPPRHQGIADWGWRIGNRGIATGKAIRNIRRGGPGLMTKTALFDDSATPETAQERQGDAPGRRPDGVRTREGRLPPERMTDCKWHIDRALGIYFAYLEVRSVPGTRGASRRLARIERGGGASDRQGTRVNYSTRKDRGRVLDLGSGRADGTGERRRLRGCPNRVL